MFHRMGYLPLVLGVLLVFSCEQIASACHRHPHPVRRFIHWVIGR